MNFFSQLNTYRKSLGKTVLSISQLTGMPSSHISNVLNGKKNAQAETLNALAGALNTEWMLIPQHIVPEVERLLSGKPIAPDQLPSTVDRLFGGNKDD